ncbi:MAG: VOC family protein [Bacteroidales bacterium]|nr:VOC family protein [Bacteroidales bacterium]
MKIEHFALNVKDPAAMAQWYIENLGLEIIRKMDKTPHTHFLGDKSGAILLEIYNNPPDQVPHYKSMDPLLVHLAFVSSDPESDKKRLTAAGASYVEEVNLPDGSKLIMMRDPWGLAIQLCQRGIPMI